MTEMNSDYLAALRSWRNEKRDFTDDSLSIDRLKFREAMQRERDGHSASEYSTSEYSTNDYSTPEHSLDNADDALLALHLLANPSHTHGDSNDINALSALSLRGAGKTNARAPTTMGGRATRHKVTITGAADSLSKAGLGSYTESPSPMMDVSTGNSARKDADAIETMLTRLQRQQNTQARYKQVIRSYTVDGTITADDADLSYPSHDKTVRKMLMDTQLAKAVYNHVDVRMVRGVLQ